MEQQTTEAFSLDEVFEIAEQMERNGEAYYTAAAEQVADEVSGIFVDLASQEREHKKIFAGMRKVFVDAEKSIARFDMDDTVAAYLRAIAGRYVFPDGKVPPDELTGDESAADIVRLAIGREKDAIVFYIGIMDTMIEESDKTSINRIIREEQRHLVDLSKLLVELS